MKVWSWLLAVTSARESATVLALFRIGMGLSTLLTVGTVVVTGLVPILWVDRADGGMRQLVDPSWLVQALGGPHPHVIYPLVGLSLLCGALMVLGVGGRLTALLALLATSAVTDVNNHAGGSYDILLANGLWLVVLAGGDQTLSVTARLRTGRWWPLVEAWSVPRWLALWQLVLMYCTTGLQKLSAYWVPGGEASALYYILQQPEWHRHDMSWMAPWFWTTQIATTVTWLWEVGAPIWLLAVWYAYTPERGGALRAWFSRLHVRGAFAAIGVMVHLIILVTMEVGPFSVLSVSYYVVTASSAEWERWLRRPA
ncbi:MAG: hypothetical protein H6735_01645 [Alphaproteobacteria bacterium]|nr:hypothetical protein [Alphaproteobacteria bacterium]